MRVSFLSEEGKENISGADLIIYAAKYKTIRYKAELSGESAELKDLAKFSAKSGALVISPFDTDNYGILRRSAGVFDKGKLLGISDATVSYEDSPYMPGVAGGIYEADFGKIGVIIGDDFYSYEILRSYALCGVKTAVAVKKDFAEMDGIVLRAYAYLVGMPIVFAAGKRIIAADFKGNVAFDGKESGNFELSTVSEYHLKVSKTAFSK